MQIRGFRRKAFTRPPGVSELGQVTAMLLSAQQSTGPRRAAVLHNKRF